MKKVLMIVMLLLTTVVGYSKEVSNEHSVENYVEIFKKEQTFEMYDFSNFDIFKYDGMLTLTDKQKKKVDVIMKDFNKKMNESFYAKNRKKKTLKTLNSNVEDMGSVLYFNQYRIYLRILNLELYRRGIDLF